MLRPPQIAAYDSFEDTGGISTPRDIKLPARQQSLADSNNLPAPDVIAQEIVEDIEAALEQFRLIAADLTSDAESVEA